MVQKFSAAFFEQEKRYRNFLQHFPSKKNGTEIFCSIFRARKTVQKFSAPFSEHQKGDRKFL